jgi:MATE family multidrug resistance protein
VLGFGALAFMLDGYFLGLTAGHTLRNAMLLAVGVGFLPVAIAAYQRRSPHLLWCALSSFMAMRALTLAWVVPQTLGSQRISTKKPSGS